MFFGKPDKLGRFKKSKDYNNANLIGKALDGVVKG